MQISLGYLKRYKQNMAFDCLFFLYKPCSLNLVHLYNNLENQAGWLMHSWQYLWQDDLKFEKYKHIVHVSCPLDSQMKLMKFQHCYFDDQLKWLVVDDYSLNLVQLYYNLENHWLVG